METREEIFERIVRKINRSAGENKTFAYELQLRDRHGIVLDTLKGNTKMSGSSVTEQVAKLENDLRASFKDYPSTYSIAGNYGQISPINARITINDVLPIENEEADEESMMPQPIVQDKRIMQQQIAQQQAIVNANHETANEQIRSNSTIDESMNLLQAFGDTFGVHGLGDINTPEGKQMSFMLQMQANKMKADAETKEHLGTIDVQKSQISELNAEIRLLKNQIEKNEKQIKEQQDKIDKMSKRIESDREMIADYKKIKTKNGRVADIAGAALGQILAGFASHTKYAGLLGLLEDEQDTDAQVEEQQIQQVTQQLADKEESKVIELE